MMLRQTACHGFYYNAGRAGLQEGLYTFAQKPLWKLIQEKSSSGNRDIAIFTFFGMFISFTVELIDVNAISCIEGKERNSNPLPPSPYNPKPSRVSCPFLGLLLIFLSVCSVAGNLAFWYFWQWRTPWLRPLRLFVLDVCFFLKA